MACDDSNKAEAGFGSRGDIIGEVVGVFVVTDDNGTEGAVIFTIENVSKEAEKRAVQDEEEKTEEEGISDNRADWKEVATSEVVERN